MTTRPFCIALALAACLTDIPIDLGSIGVDGIEIPTMSRDQYKATIDLSQSIWDGGNISSRRKAVRAQAEADRRQTDVSLYAVNARVNRVFFGLLLVDAQLGQNRNCRRVEACMAGGLANQSDADALHVDLARARQAEAQLKATRAGLGAMLSLLIGEPVDSTTQLARPTGATPPTATANRRPELSPGSCRASACLPQGATASPGSTCSTTASGCSA